MWRRSVCLALAIHTGISLAMLHYAGLGIQDVTVSALEPVVRGDLVEFEADVGPPLQDDSLNETADEPGAAQVAIEPSMAIIRDVASSLLADRDKEQAPDALEELVRKAKLLEQISSPQAVSSMSEKIRQALGTRDEVTSRPAADEPRAVDIDKCQLVDVVRVESVGVVEIRETLTDPDGHSMMMVTIRRTDSATGGTLYEQVLIEPGRAPQTVPADEEAFESALARYRPFKLIHRFPLIRQLHRQAVLPILDKLTNEPDPASRPAGETQP